MKNHLPIKTATIVINTEVIIFLIVKTENIRKIVLVHCSFSDFTLAKKIVYLNSILFGNSESTEQYFPNHYRHRPAELESVTPRPPGELFGSALLHLQNAQKAERLFALQFTVGSVSDVGDGETSAVSNVETFAFGV